MSQTSESTISTQAIQEIESIYLCPITLQLMKQPYMLQCGHTFESKNIQNYLVKQQQCPLCREQVIFEKGVKNLIALQGIQMLKKHIQRKALKNKKLGLFIRIDKTYIRYFESKAKLQDLYIQIGKLVGRDKIQLLWEFRLFWNGQHLLGTQKLNDQMKLSEIFDNQQTIEVVGRAGRLGTQYGTQIDCKECSKNQKLKH